MVKVVYASYLLIALGMTALSVYGFVAALIATWHASARRFPELEGEERATTHDRVEFWRNKQSAGSHAWESLREEMKRVGRDA